MKQAVISTLAGSAVAVSTESLAALMQFGQPSFGGNVPFTSGQNSNEARDSDLKRGQPDFAAPGRKADSDSRPVLVEEEVGPNHVPKSVRLRQAAIKDPVLALQPDVRPLFKGSHIMEPIDYSGKVFQSPVFLTDPMFMRDGEEMQLFTDNDFGGYRKPLIHTHFPIVHPMVQDFFTVGPDCTCEGNKEIFALVPRVIRLDLPQHYGQVWEPQYEDASYDFPKHKQNTCFQGDDYGGHNIPFPHPQPPMPDKMYEQHSFINVEKWFAGLPTIYDEDVFVKGQRSDGYGDIVDHSQHADVLDGDFTAQHGHGLQGLLKNTDFHGQNVHGDAGYGQDVHGDFGFDHQNVGHGAHGDFDHNGYRAGNDFHGQVHGDVGYGQESYGAEQESYGQSYGNGVESYGQEQSYQQADTYGAPHGDIHGQNVHGDFGYGQDAHHDAGYGQESYGAEQESYGQSYGNGVESYGQEQSYGAHGDNYNNDFHGLNVHGDAGYGQDAHHDVGYGQDAHHDVGYGQDAHHDAGYGQESYGAEQQSYGAEQESYGQSYGNGVESYGQEQSYAQADTYGAHGDVHGQAHGNDYNIDFHGQEAHGNDYNIDFHGQEAHGDDYSIDIRGKNVHGDAGYGQESYGAEQETYGQSYGNGVESYGQEQSYEQAQAYGPPAHGDAHGASYGGDVFDF